MKIVITGGHGYLGGHVVRALQRDSNLQVVVIGHRVQKVKETFNRADCIIHLAGVNRGTKRQIYRGNVSYTKRMLAWAKAYASNARVIFASSSQVYWKDSYYGQTKKRAEKLLEGYSRIHGNNAVILRFSNIYGPFCRPYYNSVIATFIYQIVHGKPLTVHGNGSQARDYIYVSDVVDAITRAMFYNPMQAFETYDICSGSVITLRRVISVLKKISPKSFLVRYIDGHVSGVPKKMNRVEAKPLSGWKPKITIKQGLKNIFQEEYENPHKKA
jgi:UDP-2-acetamido-2,6-beta-L-arabino-hexul-4-ose reductase